MEESFSLEDSFKKTFIPSKEPASDSFKKPAIPISNAPAGNASQPIDEKSSNTLNSFKIPIIPVSHAPTKDTSQVVVEESANTSHTSNDLKIVKKEKKNLKDVPLPYEEPDWHGHPPNNYSLEIIKNGTFVSNLPIQASLVVFGRLDVCDVIFEHPSVSRYHAVIQYCKGDDTHPKGFYLYDLGSTHGTYLNKAKVSPKIYYKLKVGFIIKFGGSSRLHIFQGPEEEEEEVKQKEVKKPEEGVCDWGMAEEAVEEDDLTENPFALSTSNEDLYIEDPKKTLRGWFEREGYELEYKVEEKGFRTFCCTIRLPIDNPTGDYLPVEASVSGKKKEAVVACALEACRTLDRLGLLRQSHQESRQKKRKQWEENDYYDSDEDTFYDRTGEIEKRREMRKRLVKKCEVNNFETISAKLTAIQSEKEDIKKKISLHELKDTNESESKEADSLDMYMSNLSESGSTISDKFERRKLKLRLIELEKEEKHLEKLANIAKPAYLPPLKKNLGFIGKRTQSKLKLPSTTKIEDPKVEKDDEKIEEDDSDDEESSEKHNTDKDLFIVVDSKTKTKNDFQDDTSVTEKYGLILNKSEVNNSNRETVLSMESPMDVDDGFKSRADISAEKSNKNTRDTTESALNIDETPVESMEISKMQSDVNKDKKQPKKSKRKDVAQVDVYKTDATEYCTWMPPKNQSGDGMTHLNAKYGY